MFSLLVTYSLYDCISIPDTLFFYFEPSVLYFLKYPTLLFLNADQKLGCMTYSRTNIFDIVVFHYTMICLLS
jgi:hypothetical protein